MQAYEENFAIFLYFVREMGGFESKEVVDWENYSDYKSIIAIIVFFWGKKKKKKLLKKH